MHFIFLIWEQKNRLYRLAGLAYRQVPKVKPSPVSMPKQPKINKTLFFFLFKKKKKRTRGLAVSLHRDCDPFISLLHRPSLPSTQLKGTL